ncbi:putative glycosyltransferase [Frankia torreyi]|uniref:Putative glycosyltransferase n=1 Tax=Frankia torreyi TaxID=1856 RepID=A0A0D8BLT2_9ACTN|nr:MULTISPECIES: glycosyltransferase family 2 protein [Frankia]KJE25075.1 putative glycosyltransferase [Frankia torreyi]KQM07267.1 putative glycosyltransferase [Frankia sp. CpI1-P]
MTHPPDTAPADTTPASTTPADDERATQPITLPPSTRPGTGPTSVIICAYSEERWHDLLAAVDSVRGQGRPPEELIVVIDHNEALLTRARDAFGGTARVLANTGRRGLSGARNTGVAAATGAVLVFLDDDARGEPDWLERLLEPYADPRVQGVGGAAVPMWPTPGRPAWFPAEFDWVVGCTHTGLPAVAAPVRNPVGAAMSFRRGAFELVGGFTEGVGRVGARPLGCEETEFGIRLRQADPGALVIHQPSAVVRHRVTPPRARPGYFWRRCYAEGISKATISRTVGRDSALAVERDYVRRTLPAAVRRYLGLRGRRRAAVAVVLGLTATTAGYLRGSASSLVTRSPRPPR